MKSKMKKIFFEVITNSKNLNIIFFNEMVNDQDFAKLTGGLDNVEYGNNINFPKWKATNRLKILNWTNLLLSKGKYNKGAQKQAEIQEKVDSVKFIATNTLQIKN